VTQDGAVRLSIRVQPGASSTAIGGRHGDALVVRVVEPADRGRATAAALGVIAEGLGVPRSSVSLLHGAHLRRKVVEIRTTSSQVADIQRRLSDLLGRSGADATLPDGGAPGPSQ
jgi:uncharacterized protein YggU (UPF0235/DUF167 family)